MANLLHHRIRVSSPEYTARWTVVVVALSFGVWLLNANVAFTGQHRVTIRKFSAPPPAVTLDGKTTFTDFQDGTGEGSRPSQNSSMLRFTLPRGFANVTTRLRYKSDPEQTVVLAAVTQPGQKAVRIAYRHPDLIPKSFELQEIPGGRLYTKKAKSAQDNLWTIISKAKKVVGIGPNVIQLVEQDIPNGQVSLQRISYPLRGNITINAYLPAGEQIFEFVKQDLNINLGRDTYDLHIRGAVGEVLHLFLEDDEEQLGKRGPQRVSQRFTVPTAGFYEITFTGNNEDSTITSWSFIGADVILHSPVFFGPRSTPTTLYTDCKEVHFDAVKTDGTQVVQFGSSKIPVTVPKRVETFLRSTTSVQSVLFPRGDIFVRSECALQMQVNQPIRKNLQNLKKKVTVLQIPNTREITTADVILDTYKLPIRDGGKFEAEANFPLNTLVAHGRAFVFEMTFPGYVERSNASVRLVDFSLIAKRPAFHILDFFSLLK